MFTLAHLSDPHLPMPPARAAELFGKRGGDPEDRQGQEQDETQPDVGVVRVLAVEKRATGYFNWWRNRVHLHVPEALAGIVADIQQQKPDHIALTGDLINISLPTEFSRAADWLKQLGEPQDVTVIPGNHLAAEPGPLGRLHGG